MYNIICIYSCRVSRTSVTCLSVLKIVDICSLLPAVGAVAEAADEQKDDHQRHHSHASSDHCRHQPRYGGHEVSGRGSCRRRLSCGCRGRERRSLHQVVTLYSVCNLYIITVQLANVRLKEIICAITNSSQVVKEKIWLSGPSPA